MRRPIRDTRRARAGYTLLEILIASTLFVVVMMASVTLIQHDQRLSRSTVQMAHVEHMAQVMLFRLEHELANAAGKEPVAILPNGLGAGATTAQVDSTLGFPPSGTLLIDRGEAVEERVDYDGLDAGQVLFQNLDRGVQCTGDFAHGVQAELLWAGLAEPIEQQVPPPDVEDYDGISLEALGPVYFRGDGIGFSYQVPVDPTGTGTYVVGNDLLWGAEHPGVGPITTGWTSLYFQPRDEFVEATSGDDLNGDGDTDDVFDVGQIRRVVWDVTNPTIPPSDVGLGPSNVLQERCNWGGDLDGDGFDDPIFLWDENTNELHVRLHLVGASIANQPITRMVESVMFLRNEPEL